MGRLVADAIPTGQRALDYIRAAGGRVVTSQELTRHLFGPSASVARHRDSVRAAIHGARNLLGESAADRDQIMTVYGVGSARRGAGWRWQWRQL